MSFDAELAILFGLLFLAMGLLVVRAIATGQVGWGKDAPTRATKPVEFWYGFFELLLQLAVLPPLIWLFVLGTSQRPVEPLDLVILLILIPTAFRLVRNLHTGVAGGGELSFSRREEPKEYWALFLLNAAFLVFVSDLLNRLLSS